MTQSRGASVDLAYLPWENDEIQRHPCFLLFYFYQIFCSSSSQFFLFRSSLLMIPQELLLDFLPSSASSLPSWTPKTSYHSTDSSTPMTFWDEPCEWAYDQWFLGSPMKNLTTGWRRAARWFRGHQHHRLCSLCGIVLFFQASLRTGVTFFDIPHLFLMATIATAASSSLPSELLILLLSRALLSIHPSSSTPLRASQALLSSRAPQ